MKIAAIIVVGLLVLLVVAYFNNYLPISGGELNGTSAPVPTDWRTVASAKIIQLESRPSDPYSVNLWVIGEETHLYIFAGASRAAWVDHIAADPNVRLKIGDAVYDLQAERVTDAAEFERFAQAWKAKYGNRPRNENVGETYLMRLTARS